MAAKVNEMFAMRNIIIDKHLYYINARAHFQPKCYYAKVFLAVGNAMHHLVAYLCLLKCEHQ